MSIERELTRIKEKLDAAENKKTKLEGQKEQLLIQLKEKFNVASIEKSEKLLVKMKRELENMKSRLDSGLEQFEEDFGELLEDF